MYLHDAVEREAFEGFMRYVDAHRRGNVVQDATPAAVQTHEEKVAEASKAVIEEHGETLQRLADTPVPAPAAEPVDVEAAFRKFATDKGSPAALALLTEFGAKRLNEVPKDRLQEFIKRLS